MVNFLGNQRNYLLSGHYNQNENRDFVIKNVNLIDVRKKEIGYGFNVRIVKGKIYEIGRKVSAHPNIPVVDGTDLFALPGLIDLHVHLVWDGSKSPLATMQKEGLSGAALRGASNALSSLRMGVTTLRDVGSPGDVAVDIAKAFDSGLLLGPTVFPLGRILQPTGGHVPEIGYVANGIKEVVTAVRALKERGVKGIKMASTGGAYGPEEIGPAVYTFEEMKAIVDEAHRLNLKVSTHALGYEGIRLSVEAGIDTIEHGAGIAPEVIRDMKHRGTVLIPTLAVYKMLAESKDMIPDEYVEKAEKVVQWHEETFNNAMKEGVLIALGTDAGSPNFGPHPSVNKEIELMVSYGMDPFEAITAATCKSAMVLGMENSVGYLESGFNADILLVKENPIEDITALRNISKVFKNGIDI